MSEGTTAGARALLGWALLAGAVAVVVALAPRSAGAQPAPDVLLGSNLYATSCAACHGSDGGGGILPDSGGAAPALAGRGDEVTAAYIDLVIRTGRMPPAGDPFDNRSREVTYEGAQREALVAYAADAFDLEVDLPDPPPGDPALGLQSFASNCAQCHGNAGAGGVAGAGAWTPKVNEYDPVTVAEAIRVGPFQMPAFNEEQLDPDDVGDIAAYLTAIDAAQTTPLRLTELNPVFASGFVAVLALAVLLSCVWIAGRPTWFPDASDPGTSDPGAADPRPPVEDAR